MPDPDHAIWRTLPFFEPHGQFSMAKATAFAGATAPALWMVIEVNSGRWDMPSPYVALIYHSGLWATYLLLVTLMLTPLHRITRWSALPHMRRMIGVASCCYALLHVVAWGGLRFWDWQTLGSELATRPSLWLAVIAAAVIVALAVTSLDSMVRRMGRRRWKRLHRLVYCAGLLAIAHVLMSPGSVQGVPFLLAGLYCWTVGWRLLERHGLGTAPRALYALGLLATAATVLLQPLWLATWQSEHAYLTPLEAVLENVNPQAWSELGVPPGLTVLTWGTVVAYLAQAIASRQFRRG